jgi:succinyl-CoA synthetase alpha subunit
VKGTEFIDMLEMFLADDQDRVHRMIGEIGGSAEEEAAQFVADEAKRGRKKPMVGFIAGPHRPSRAAAWAMPGAIISGGKGGARTRSPPWRLPGVRVSPSPARLGTTLAELLRG